MRNIEKWKKILIKYLNIDTSNPPGKNYRQALLFLKSIFKDAGFDAEVLKIPRRIACERFNLLANLRNRGKPRLLVYNHIDVVPADEDWHPFCPVIRNGRIYARGVADMKGATIAFLAAAESLKNKKLPWDITVMVTTDEETNQENQIKYLLKKIDNVKGAVLLDLDSIFGYVSVGGLGCLQVKIKIKGKSVHSGISHTGVNAIEKSILVLNALLRLKRKVENRFSKIPVNPELGIKTMQAKLNVNVIRGGLKINIVPDNCEIEIDRRLIPEEKIKDAKDEILRTLNSLRKDVDLEVEFVHGMSGYAKITQASRKFNSCLKKIIGRGNIYGVMGSGDLLSLASKYNWEVVGIGAGRDKESNIHGRKENIRVEDFNFLVKVLELFLSSS